MQPLSWRKLNQPKQATGIKTWPILRWFFKAPKRRVILRDYQTKTFVNPFYQPSNQPRRTHAIKLKLAVLFLAVALTIGLLFRHPFFTITQINFSGWQKISPQVLQGLVDGELAKSKFLIFSNRNYWLANTDNIAKAIAEHYSLDSLNVSTKFPRTLNIDLKEKEAALAYKTDTNTWLLDNQGRVIQEAPGNDITVGLPTVYSDSLVPAPKINTVMVPPATIKFLTFLQTKIPEVTKVEIDQSRLIDGEGRVLHLKTKEKWEIYLDRQNDWDKQINVLATILNTKLKNGRDKLHYIDVRYENRAYFQ